MRSAGMSPPEIIMLSGMFKRKYIGFFVGVVIAGAIVTGYLFNILI